MATYIERETYRNRLADLESWCQDLRKPGLKQALEMFDEVPAADVAPVVRGRWMYEKTEGGFHIWRCSRCGRGMNDNPEGIDLYCYHCGAKMDGGDSDAAD